MTSLNKYRLINYFITLIWLVNGLFCKVLNFVPRHKAIVTRILGPEHSSLFTFLIGLSEIVMACWILSGIMPRTNVFVQIMIISAMNILEFFLAPDLLLWGKANALFAFLFVLLIYYNRTSYSKTMQRV